MHTIKLSDVQYSSKRAQKEKEIKNKQRTTYKLQGISQEDIDILVPDTEWNANQNTINVIEQAIMSFLEKKYTTSDKKFLVPFDIRKKTQKIINKLDTDNDIVEFSDEEMNLLKETFASDLPIYTDNVLVGELFLS